MRRENEHSDRLLISVREAAARLGIGRDATYELVREGRLPVVRVGRRVLIPARFLAEWVDRQIDTSIASSKVPRNRDAEPED